MKFLVIRRPIRTGGNPPTSKAIREHNARVLEAMKQGTIDFAYAFPGGGGSVVIANVESAEDLNARIADSPLFLNSEFEIHALTDYAKYMDSVAAALEKSGR